MPLINPWSPPLSLSHEEGVKENRVSAVLECRGFHLGMCREGRGEILDFSFSASETDCGGKQNT